MKSKGSENETSKLSHGIKRFEPWSISINSGTDDGTFNLLAEIRKKKKKQIMSIQNYRKEAILRWKAKKIRRLSVTQLTVRRGPSGSILVIQFVDSFFVVPSIHDLGSISEYLFF
ncbi:hypothetical protein ACH5RR_006333 [Cinchona calisaya]|uniref:Uncharacterized protein n=1 Tax=Cinchona calisaya TaxID=153742 RepID=A0ABD3ANY5_9GENT